MKYSKQELINQLTEEWGTYYLIEMRRRVDDDYSPNETADDIADRMIKSIVKMRIDE